MYKILNYVKNKRTVLNNLIILSLSKYFKQGIVFIKALLLASLFSVEDFGAFSLFMLFITFSVFISLGTTYALNKELSVSRNKSNLIQEEIINKSIVILLVSNILFFILFIIITININTVFNHAIYIVYLGVVIHQYNIFYENILRSFQQFKRIAIGYVLMSVLDIGLIVLFLNYISLNTVVIIYLFAVIVTNLYYKKNVRKSVRIKLFSFKNINRRGLKKHLLIGFSLLLYNLNYLLFVNSDKIIVSSLIGIEELGIYSFATNIVAGTMVLFQGLNYIMYPKLLEKYSVITSREEALLFYKKMLIGLIILVLFLNIILFYASSIFIKNLYMEYIDSIDIILILYIGQIFSTLSIYSNTISIAQNRENILIRIQMFCLFINVLFGVIFAYFGMGINSIAIVTVFSQLILCYLSVKSAVHVINTNSIRP